MLSVGLLGATGYTGKKLIQICQQHPYISDYTLYAYSSADQMLWDIFPELSNVVENKQVKSIANLSTEHNVYFITLPHGEALKYIPALIANDKKVIDLGGDYRLDFEELYRQWYHFEHTSPYLLKSKTYGLADYIDAAIYENSRLIANPGCFPTAVLLGLLPLVENFPNFILSASSIAYSGTSGAGKSARADLMISEMDGNVKAYNVNEHRHEPEILQMLYKHKFNSPYSFTTHLLPVAVGIYATTTVHLKNEIDAAAVKSVYEKSYKDKPFIRLRDVPPELKWVVNTNFCDINVAVSGNTIIITSAIDNLIKGAAGQAFQNMNKLFGWEETIGFNNQLLMVNY